MSISRSRNVEKTLVLYVFFRKSRNLKCQKKLIKPNVFCAYRTRVLRTVLRTRTRHGKRGEEEEEEQKQVARRPGLIQTERVANLSKERND